MDLSVRLPWGGARAPWRQLEAIVARCFWRRGGWRKGLGLPLFLGGHGTRQVGPTPKDACSGLPWCLSALLAQGEAILTPAVCCASSHLEAQGRSDSP